MQKFFFDSVRKNALSKAAAVVVSLAAFAGVTSAQAATTGDHNKTVVGYITQWEPWKANNAGYPVAGSATHLNVDMSQYTILNFSFFGVAQDGSLHSGDFRNKQIYQAGQVQAPAALLYTDTYSSWDLYLLWGELDPQQYVGAGSQNEAELKAQGFTWTDTTWTHTASGLTGAYPIPKQKVGGKPGLIAQAHSKGVKVMASIGGWSMCKHFPEMAADPVKRAKFMQGAKTLIGLGFDGIDIDWEYPGAAGMNIENYSNADYGNFLTLMKDIRATIGPDKLITAAFSANPTQLEGFNWPELDKVMDHYNFMTYDYNGGWSNKAGHNSPLYDYTGSEYPTFNWDSLAKFITAKGVTRSKINMGFGFYGRGVVTQAPATLNQTTIKTSVTVSPDGPVSTAADFTNWAADVYDGTPNYFFIKKQTGWTDHWDDQAKVPYMTKDSGGRSYFLSYDNEQSIGLKAQYVNDNSLGGAIVWHVHGDFDCVNGYTMSGKLAVCNAVNPVLAKKINSVFATGGVNSSSSKSSVSSSSSSSSSVACTSSSAMSTTCSSKSSSSSVVSSSSSVVSSSSSSSSIASCGGLPTWSASAIYNTAGQQVSYNGVKYENRWWTQNENPATSSASGGVWINKGSCGSSSSSSVESSSSSSSVVSSVSSSSSVASSVSSSSSSTGSICTSPAYVDRAAYADGAKVQNGGSEYQCKVGGWCTVGGPYAPGSGWAWDNAWTLVRACQ
ncbi:MAG: chitinase [Moraxellaceae bacterium]|nr:MAG: chitinase [Moraxellaceae bacterium]